MPAQIMSYGYYPMPQMAPVQYIEYSPGVFYPVGMLPTSFYPQRVISVVPPKNDEVVSKLLDDFDKSIEDQSSCRLLQKRLEEEQARGETKMAQRLYDKMINNIVTYMNSTFGNYLCQKLFEQLKEEQLYLVVKRAKERVTELCNDLHGTRSFQQLIRASVKSSELRKQIAQVLTGHIYEIITVRYILFATNRRTSTETTSSSSVSNSCNPLRTTSSTTKSSLIVPTSLCTNMAVVLCKNALASLILNRKHDLLIRWSRL